VIQSVTSVEQSMRALLNWLVEDNWLVACPSMAAILCSLKSCNGMKFSLLLFNLVAILTCPLLFVITTEDPSFELLSELALTEFNWFAAEFVISMLLLVKIRLFIEVVKLASANSPLQRG